MTDVTRIISLVWDLWLHLPLGSLKYSAMWCAFCVLVHIFVGWATPEIIDNFDKRIAQEKDRRDWYNRAVSIMHASVMFCRALFYWILFNPAIILPTGTNQTALLRGAGAGFDVITLDIMMGYLWYDILIEVSKEKISKTTLLHHIVGYVSLFCTRATGSKLGCFYFMLVFVAEGSTPVLHTLWLLHKLECTAWALYKALAFLLLVLFFALRIVLGPYTIHHLATHQAAWAEEEPHGTWMYRLLLAISIVFVSINYYWFQLLVKMAMPKKSRKKKET